VGGAEPERRMNLSFVFPGRESIEEMRSGDEEVGGREFSEQMYG